DAFNGPALRELERHIIRCDEQSMGAPIIYDPHFGTPAPQPQTATAVVITADHLDLLRDCAKYEGEAVVARYQRLGISTGRAHRIKSELVKEGLLIEEQLPGTGNGRPQKRLRLSEDGKRKLSQKNSASS